MRPRAVRLPPWAFGSGPAVGALYGRLFAAIAVGAWISLGTQARLLIGSRGLLPVADFMEAVRAQGGASWLQLPTLFRWTQSDGAVVGGTVAGAALALAAFAARGWARQVCLGLSALLYLSYVTACRTFLAFQWDNLLLECGLLAAFLPSGRPAPLVHFLFRVLLFKLYFESGIAKWQSPIGDWQDGSAMTFYYETAPLPAALAWRAHDMPVGWHHFESWATLVVELVLPLGIFGPRRVRLAVAAVLTAFQIGNAATANYGFFCYLAVALHVFLLDDADVARAAARLARAVPAPVARWVKRLPRWRRAGPEPAEAAATEAPPPRTRWLRWPARAGAAVYLLASLVSALFAFSQPGAWLEPLFPLVERAQTFRFANTYHLFASITRERIEPELQTLGGDNSDGEWSAHDLRYKPGDVRRAPGFVAPHQPRVDFQLWFHGLQFRRGEPAYLSTLVERMCEDPPAVQDLFVAPLPPRPRAVRIAYWRYHFTTRAEARASGAWWRRELLGTTRTVPCPTADPR